MNDPTYYCGEPDGDCPPELDGLSRRALRSMATERAIEQCDHPESWREPDHGQLGAGRCRLCDASATTIARAKKGQQRGERRPEIREAGTSAGRPPAATVAPGAGPVR